MILLTFNVLTHEEKLKSGIEITAAELQKITVNNVESVLRILENHDLKCTFFIGTKIVADSYPLLKKIIAAGHEIGFFNEGIAVEPLRELKKTTENILGKQIKGFRQRKHLLSYALLKELGFNYVSNLEHSAILFPFKRLERSTEIIEKDGISIVPDSISPYSQLPYNDFVFQVIPIQFYENMVNETLKNDQFVMIYLDISQFTDLQRFPFKIPFYRKLNSGKKMEDRLEHFLNWITKHEHATARMKDYLF